jgi:hypothetical protein
MADNTSDIVDRLRGGAIYSGTEAHWEVDEFKTDELMGEAADEIERLREEVEQLRLEQSLMLRSAKYRGRRMEWLEALVRKYKALATKSTSHQN